MQIYAVMAFFPFFLSFFFFSFSLFPFPPPFLFTLSYAEDFFFRSSNLAPKKFAVASH